MTQTERFFHEGACNFTEGHRPIAERIGQACGQPVMPAVACAGNGGATIAPRRA